MGLLDEMYSDENEDAIRASTWDLPIDWDNFYRAVAGWRPNPDELLSNFSGRPVAANMPADLRAVLDLFLSMDAEGRDAMRPVPE